MAIETSAGGTMITGSDIQTFRLLAFKKAMEIELKTGMKASRVCPFKAARQQFGISARSKQKVYEQFCSLHNL